MYSVQFDLHSFQLTMGLSGRNPIVSQERSILAFFSFMDEETKERGDEVPCPRPRCW